MTISFVAQNSAESTSVTLPTHQKWDLLVILAHRHASQAAPTFPSGWRLIGRSAGGSNGIWLLAKLAASAAETSGTFTNADHLAAVTYRSDTNLLGIANPANNTGTGGSGAAINYAALDGVSPVTNKWVLGCYGHRSNDTDINTAPAGMTNRANQVGATNAETGIHDSNANYTSWSSTNYTLTAGTSSGWKTLVVELAETNILLSSLTSGKGRQGLHSIESGAV